MDADAGPSSALARKRNEMALMPPPPPAKKIKRPKQVLDEDSYTETLSQIIARDFFPGLLETELQQEYLDAVEAQDPAWISSASRRLKQATTPGRRQSQPTPRQSKDGGRHPTTYTGDTPTTYAGDTPISTVSDVAEKQPRVNTNMSLSRFQSTCTSEDNESFYKLVDNQNQKKAAKYGWLWQGNKLASQQMLKQGEVHDKVARARGLIDDGFRRDRLAIKDADQRPARPDAWNAGPRNGLMFQPDDTTEGIPTVAQQAEEWSRMAPKSIVYENTGIPQPYVPQRPPSPTMSSVRDAIAGRPREGYQDSSVAGGGETPRVNGYPFVDDEEDDEADAVEPPPPFSLGKGDTTNPFKLQERRKRETLHERMVDRISKSNKEASRKGLTGRAIKTEVPRFPSSPRVAGDLTPAAQRLLSRMGTPANRTGGHSFGSPTPLRPRSSLVKSVSRVSSKTD